MTNPKPGRSRRGCLIHRAWVFATGMCQHCGLPFGGFLDSAKTTGTSIPKQFRSKLHHNVGTCPVVNGSAARTPTYSWTEGEQISGTKMELVEPSHQN